MLALFVEIASEFALMSSVFVEILSVLELMFEMFDEMASEFVLISITLASILLVFYMM